MGVQPPDSTHIPMWPGTVYSTLVKLIVSSEVGLVVLKPQKLPAWSSKVCHSDDRKKPWDLPMFKNEGEEGR